MLYEVPFKNKITITGVVQNEKIVDFTGMTCFSLITCRPSVSEKETCVTEELDTYTIYTYDSEKCKSGDLVTITGVGIIVKSQKNLVCPICGTISDAVPGSKFGILANSITKKEIPNEEISDKEKPNKAYHNAVFWLLKNTNNNNRNNIIEIENVVTLGEEYCEGLRYCLDSESALNALYQISSNKKSMVKDYDVKRYSFIGSLALVQEYDHFFNCKTCNSWVFVDNKMPVVFCIEEPKITS